jgi:hypothetical protein
LIGEAEGIEEALLTLEMRGLVDERLGSSLEGEREYAFSHILIRDVASATLPRRARADAHAHTAEWLERTIGDRRREYGELLAHHYEQAFRLTNDPALREKARSEALAAARNAISRAAVGPARALATRALELSMEAVERAEALELLGDVHHFRHDGNAAWDAYVSALDECDACHRRDLLAGVAAKAAILATRWEGTLQTPVPTDEVRTVIERGMTALPDEKPSRERSLLLSSKAFLQGQGYEHNDAAGREAARDALEIAETLHDPDLISTALDASAFWLLPEARYGEIDRIERRRLDLVPRLVDSREISDVYAVAALSATFMGRYGEAATLSEEAVERARGLDPGQYLYSLSWRTLTRFLNGNWDGALTDHAEVETLESKDAEGLPLPYAAAPYAAAMMCHELRGDTAAAQAYLDLLERYRARQDLRGAPIGVTRMLAARAYVHRGEPERAWAWIKLDRAPYVGANIEAACEVVAEGPETRAWEIVHVAREESLRAQSPALALHADRLEGRILARRGRESDKAVELLAGAARGLGALGAPWEEAWTRLILARVLGDADEREAARHAQAALATFEALGSIREAAESRSLLKR